MAKDGQASDVVMCDGVPAANSRGISRLLWYIYDRKVSRIEAARLIHEYTVAWADNRDKKILSQHHHVAENETASPNV